MRTKLMRIFSNDRESTNHPEIKGWVYLANRQSFTNVSRV